MDILNVLKQLRDDIKLWTTNNLNALNSKIDEKTIPIDNELSSTSTNPVQNQAIAKEIDALVEELNNLSQKISNKTSFSGDYNDLINAPNITEDDSGNMVIVDESGNIIFKADIDGIHTTAVSIDGEAAATEKYVNDAVANIDIPDVDFTGYATEEFVDTAINTAKEELSESIISESGEWQIVDNNGNIALRIDNSGMNVADLKINGEDAATEKYVDDRIGEIKHPDIEIINDTTTPAATENLVNVYQDLKVDENNKHKLHETLVTVVKKEYVDEAIKALPKTDLTGYYTKTETDTAIENAKEEISESIVSESDEWKIVDSSGNIIFSVDASGAHTTKMTLNDQKVATEDYVKGVVPDFETDPTVPKWVKDLKTKPTIAEWAQDDEHLTVTKAEKEAWNDKSIEETDPTVPDWAKAPTKPEYTATEVHALPDTTAIPETLSDLTDDATHRTVTDAEKATWNEKSDFSGDYDDLTNAPNIEEDESGTLRVADNKGNIILDVDGSGIHTTSIVTSGDLVVNGEIINEEKFIEITSPDVFEYDGSEWNRNPVGSFILTEDFAGNELPGDDYMTHRCTYLSGDIVRCEKCGYDPNTGVYSLRQTIYHSWAEFQHYRVWRAANYEEDVDDGWCEWNITADFPKPETYTDSNTNITYTIFPDKLVGIGKLDEETPAGVTQMTYAPAKDTIKHWGEFNFPSYTTEQTLTDAQKQIARDNIGAKGDETFISFTNLSIFNYDTSTGAFKSNPLLSYEYTMTGTENLEDTPVYHPCKIYPGDIVRGEIISVPFGMGDPDPLKGDYGIKQTVYNGAMYGGFEHYRTFDPNTKQWGEWRRSIHYPSKIFSEEDVDKNHIDGIVCLSGWEVGIGAGSGTVTVPPDILFDKYLSDVKGLAAEAPKKTYNPTLSSFTSYTEEIGCFSFFGEAPNIYKIDDIALGSSTIIGTARVGGDSNSSRIIVQYLIDENQRHFYRNSRWFPLEGVNIEQHFKWENTTDDNPGGWQRFDKKYVDEKLDTKLNTSTEKNSVYGINTDGVQTTFKLGTANNNIAKYYSSGSGTIQPSGYLTVHNPVNAYQVANKNYVDTNFVAKDTNGNVSISGNLTVAGQTYTQEKETIRIADNIIELNSNAQENITTLSGIAINKNATSTYGIMYNPTKNTVDLGEGTVNNDGEFRYNTNEGSPLAIRDNSENIKDGAIMVFKKYDESGKEINKLVDSGFTIESMKQWVREYIEQYMSTEEIIEQNTDGTQTLNVSVENPDQIKETPDGSLIIGG